MKTPLPIPRIPREATLVRLGSTVGLLSDPGIGERVHEIGHHGIVEYLDIGGDDVRRHRLRLRTDHGTDCAIALPRHAALQHGAVLLLEKERAIVVRVAQRKWLRLTPVDVAAALELGYFAGNMHWSVRFDGDRLLVEQQGAVERYLERLEFMIAARRVTAIEEGDA